MKISKSTYNVRIVNLLKAAINPDDPREFMRYFHAEAGNIYATDGHLLVRASTTLKDGIYIPYRNGLTQIVLEEPPKYPLADKLIDTTYANTAIISQWGDAGDKALSQFAYKIYDTTSLCFDIHYLRALMYYSREWDVSWDNGDGDKQPLQVGFSFKYEEIKVDVALAPLV